MGCLGIFIREYCHGIFYNIKGLLSHIKAFILNLIHSSDEAASIKFQCIGKTSLIKNVWQ